MGVQLSGSRAVVCILGSSGGDLGVQLSGVSITSAQADKEVVGRWVSWSSRGKFSWKTILEVSLENLCCKSLLENSLGELYWKSFLGDYLSLRKLSWKSLLEISLGNLSWKYLLQRSLGKLS